MNSDKPDSKPAPDDGNSKIGGLAEPISTRELPIPVPRPVETMPPPLAGTVLDPAMYPHCGNCDPSFDCWMSDKPCRKAGHGFAQPEPDYRVPAQWATEGEPPGVDPAMASVGEVRLSEDLATAIFEALGYASLCWEPRPAGVFDSGACEVVGRALLAKVRELTNRETQPAGEVPLPAWAFTRCESRGEGGWLAVGESKQCELLAGHQGPHRSGAIEWVDRLHPPGEEEPLPAGSHDGWPRKEPGTGEPGVAVQLGGPLGLSDDRPVKDPVGRRKDRVEALRGAINAYSLENGSDTPDWILAELLISVLESFDRAVRAREKWYGRDKGPGLSAAPRGGANPNSLNQLNAEVASLRQQVEQYKQELKDEKAAWSQSCRMYEETSKKALAEADRLRTYEKLFNEKHLECSNVTSQLTAANKRVRELEADREEEIQWLEAMNKLGLDRAFQDRLDDLHRANAGGESK